MQLSTFARRGIAAIFLFTLIVLGVYALRWQPFIDDVIHPNVLAPAEAVTVRLYFADGDAQCLLVESRLLIVDGTELEHVSLAALTALAEGPHEPDLWPTIPSGARVLGLSVQDGLAVVSYSAQLRTNHGGGSAGEMLTVGSIAATLSEFVEVDAVQILLEGDVMETLVGHLSLVDPVSIDADALRQGTICWDGIY